MTRQSQDDAQARLNEARKALERAARSYKQAQKRRDELAEECKRLAVEVRRLGGTRDELVGKPFSHAQVSAILREAGLVKTRR